MTFGTEFSIGDRVRLRPGNRARTGVDGSFTVGQIRIQTLPAFWNRRVSNEASRWPLTLIEYRAVYTGGSYGQWRAEGMLEPVR